MSFCNFKRIALYRRSLFCMHVVQACFMLSLIIYTIHSNKYTFRGADSLHSTTSYLTDFLLAPCSATNSLRHQWIKIPWCWKGWRFTVTTTGYKRGVLLFISAASYSVLPDTQHTQFTCISARVSVFSRTNTRFARWLNLRSDQLCW